MLAIAHFAAFFLIMTCFFWYQEEATKGSGLPSKLNEGRVTKYLPVVGLVGLLGLLIWSGLTFLQ